LSELCLQETTQCYGKIIDNKMSEDMDSLPKMQTRKNWDLKLHGYVSESIPETVLYTTAPGNALLKYNLKLIAKPYK